MSYRIQITNNKKPALAIQPSMWHSNCIQQTELKAHICHLYNMHKKDIEILEAYFESLSAFLVW